MRFSPAKLKGFLAAPLLFACAHAAAPAKATSPAPATPPLSLEALEQREFKNPEDPEIKFQIGRRYWCAQKKGPAVEQWIWVEQRAGTSASARQSKDLLSKIKEDPEAVTKALKCDEFATFR